MEEAKDLLRLDSRDIVNPAVASSICCAEEKGIKQFKMFVTDRLVNQSMPNSEHIKKNKLLLFSPPPPPTKSNTNLQISSLKNDVSLFSRLYSACQSRYGNLDEFFHHENQACPPSLSLHGKLRLDKSELLHCLEMALGVLY